MPRIYRIAFLALCVANAAFAEESGAAIEFRGPKIKPGYPDAIALGYQYREEDLSPDRRFGIIHANSNVIDTERARNFLITLAPFRILAVNEGPAFYQPGNQRDMTVQWAKDSSAALVLVGDRWGTIGATLFESREGRITRRIDIMAAITAALTPKFPKGKVEPYNDHYLFLLHEEREFALSEDGTQVHIDITATNDPKYSTPKTWAGTFKAIWSVAAAQWSEQKADAKIITNDRE